MADSSPDMLPAIADMQAGLTATVTALATWFDQPADLRRYRPAAGGRTADELGEHVGLTNHSLLILVDKTTRKGLLNAQTHDLTAPLAEYKLQSEKPADIGRHQSFAWIRPEHMDPTGTRSPAEVRAQLLAHCRQTLATVPNGEGPL